MSERSFQDIRKVAEEALERAEKATEGPWEAIADDRGGPHLWTTEESPAGVEALMLSRYGQGMIDADYAAWCRNNIEDLARAVIEQQEEIERLREQLERKDELIAGFKFGEREAT